MYLIRAARPDLVIPMPTGGDLPAKGIVLPALDLYWTRRLAEKVILVDVVGADEIDAAIAQVAAIASPAKAAGRAAQTAPTFDTAEQKG